MDALSQAINAGNDIYNKISLKILPMLFIGLICAYVDRVNISFAQLRVTEDLNFSNSVYGFGAGIFFVGYILFEIPSNILLTKFGAKRWISRIMISWGIISGLMLFVRTPLEFYIIRFLLGVAEAGFFPGVILYLTYWYPANKIRSITSIFIISIPTANMIGGFISWVILKGFSDSSLMKDWQWLFLIQAIPSVILGIIVYKLLPDGIKDAPWLSIEEKNYLIYKKSAYKNQEPTVIKNIFKDSRVLLLIIIGSCFSVGMYGLIFWLPIIIKNTGITDSSTLSFLSSIPWVFSIISLLLVSKIPSCNFQKKFFVSIPGIICSIGMIMSIVFSGNLYFSLLFLILSISSLMCVFPGFWGLTIFLDKKGAIIGIAAINSMSNIAGFFSPYLIGKILDLTGNISYVMLFMAGFTLIGSMVAHFKF